MAPATDNGRGAEHDYEPRKDDSREAGRRHHAGAAGDHASGGRVERRTLDRARQGDAVQRHPSRDDAGHQRDAGCDSAAHRRRQPDPGADFRGQDRRADRADLQGRPRKDEAGGQQRGHRDAGAAEGTGAADRSLEGRPASRIAASRSSSRARTPRSCAA